MSLTIRPIEAKDDRAVATIIRTVMPEFGASGPGFAIHDPEVDAMSQNYAREHGRRYFVVTDGDKVLGGGGIAPLEGGDPKVCELRKMYFLKEVRGRGMGKAIIERCFAEARRIGYEQCYLETFGTMKRAQQLYADAGFRRLAAPMGATGHFACDQWFLIDL